MSVWGNRSFLSSEVKYLLCEIYNESEIKNEWNRNGIYQLAKIEDTFDSVVASALKNNFLQVKEDFQLAVKNLLPFFQQVSKIKYTMQEIDSFYKRMPQWMGVSYAKDDLKQWFKLKEISHPQRHLHLLHMISVLERGLGNIYLLKGGNCPFLLRDLVRSDELLTILGDTFIKFLQVLLDGPLSLNLRNLLWHGFLSEAELPQIFPCTILYVLIKLPLLLTKHGLLHKVKPRPFIQKSTEFDLIKNSKASLLTNDHEGEIELLFQSSPFIPATMLAMFQHALQFFISKRFGDCVLILLPQIEHLLRCRYSLCNDCPDRTLTAESTEFYTTIDEVLHERLNDGKGNKLKDELTDQTLVFIMDLFTLPDGLRLRDHISHGEMNHYDLDENIASLILCLAIVLSHQRYNNDNIVMSKSLEHEIECQTCEGENIALTCFCVSTCECKSSALFQKLTQFFYNHDALFHHLSFVKRDALFSLCFCEKPPQDLHQLRDLLLEPEPSSAAEFSELCNKLSDMSTNHVKKLFPNISASVFDLDSLNCGISKLRLSTLYRNHSNDTLLRQIASCVKKISLNISNHLEERSRQYTDRSLRSRRRKNLQRILTCYPVFISALRLLSFFLLSMIYNLQLLNDIPQRKLKQVLQVCENAVTFTSIHANKWDECVAVFEKLTQLLWS